MSVTIDEFWRLLTESQLLSVERCQQLGQDFAQVKGASQQSNAPTLAAWLQSQDLVSRYQAKILLAGRAGPFVYGEYVVTDRIKDGPLAGQFRAKHAATNHAVILVFLSGTAIQAPRLWQQISQRMTAYCEIVHPHLAKCHELVDLTTFKYLVMEGLQGQTLDKVVASAGGRFAPQEACRIARQAALGAGQLHQMGLVRGDVRPATIWMEPGGNIKLPHNPTVQPGPLDLQSFDPTNRLLARADYLAPELIQAGKAPDHLTDIYGLGCLLYTLLAGQPPFPGGNVSQTMARHATEPIQPLDTAYGVPEPISKTVAYMMAKNPSVRYASATDVANALGPYVDHSVVTPLPALAVPTLPAFESSILSKRAQLTAAAATAPAQPASTEPARPIPVIRTEPVTQTAPTATSLPEAAAPQSDAAAAEDGAGGDTVAGAAGEAGKPDASAGGFWNTRNLIIAIVLGVILLIAAVFGAWRWFGSPATPNDPAAEAVDNDEGPTDQMDAAGGDPAPAGSDTTPP